MITSPTGNKMKSKSIIGIESLDRIFEQNKNPEQCTYRGKCECCGCFVKIEISKTSGGFGMLGGVLYEPEPQKYLVQCVDCYEKREK